MDDFHSNIKAFNQNLGLVVLDSFPFSNPDGVSETDINATWVCDEIVHTEPPDVVVNRNFYSGDVNKLGNDLLTLLTLFLLGGG